MATESTTKVRLVRCPGCRNVLAELPHVLLYQCGGCGTVLQAKNRKSEKTTDASEHNPETSISNAVLTRPGSAQSSPDQDTPGCNRDVPSIPRVSNSEVEESSKPDDPSGQISRAEESSTSARTASDVELVPEALIEGLNFEGYDSNVIPSSGELIPQSREEVQEYVEDDFVGEIPDLPELEDEETTMLPQKGGLDPTWINSDFNERRQRTDPLEQEDHEMEKNTNVAMIAPQRSVTESLVSHYLTCPDDEPLDPSPKGVTRDYTRLTSIDTLGSSSNLADFSSDLNFNYGSAAKYPPASSYYADDGSESSYDGTKDQIRKHLPLRHRKDVDYTNMEERVRIDDDFLTSSEPERNYWGIKSSNRLARSGDVSRLRSMPRDPSGYHRHDLLPPRPGFNSADKGTYSDVEKMELLRRVNELKDQLNRIQFPKVPAQRRYLFPPGAMDGKFSPSHYDHFSPEREIYSDPSRAYHHGQGCAEGCGVLRPAFSGEVAHYQHRLGCACLYCQPQDWHYSAQLPCKKGCCAVHTDHSYVPGALSPQHHTSSELLLWGCGETTMSGKQRRDEIKRLRLKERYQKAKKHLLLPVAGAAPFVSCYECFELLQLPADFLLSNRRYLQLRCNACRNILKFSFLKGEGPRLIPFLPNASSPPLETVAAGDYTGGGRSRNVELMSHSISCQHRETMSYLDYGQSFCQSCSTEGEASIVSSSAKQVRRIPYNRKMMSSGSSLEPVGDRKMKSVLREDRSVNGTRAVESVRPSWQKGASEIEELNSPLHQLMGYSSPSQVLGK